MDNLKSSAYPVPVDQDNPMSYGFTKLEIASLMIAQGMMSNTILGDNRDEVIAEHSVSIAKAVLEEANK